MTPPQLILPTNLLDGIRTCIEAFDQMMPFFLLEPVYPQPEIAQVTKEYRESVLADWWEEDHGNDCDMRMVDEVSIVDGLDVPRMRAKLVSVRVAKGSIDKRFFIAVDLLPLALARKA